MEHAVYRCALNHHKKVKYKSYKTVNIKLRSQGNMHIIVIWIMIGTIKLWKNGIRKEHGELYLALF